MQSKPLNSSSNLLAQSAGRLRNIFDRHEFLALASVFLIINFITMPKVAYRGDPMAVRCAAAHLVQTHSFGIGSDKTPALQFFIEDKGQYFVFNEKKQLYFSKWGVITTLLFTPPLVVDHCLYGINQTYDPSRGKENVQIYTKELVFLLNLYHLCIGLAVVYYLLKLAHLYTKNIPAACAFTLCSAYATFLWNYLRAQSLEIFQVLFFLGLTYHLIVFIRSRASAHPRWRDLSIATFFAGMMVLTKPLFLLLFPSLWIFSIVTRAQKKGWILSTLDAVKANWKNYALWLGLPTLLVGLTGAALNQYQFGSPLESGYTQLNVGPHGPHIRYSLAFLPKATYGYLFHPRFSIFWHYPLLIFALFGFRAFLKKYPLELGFIFAAFLSMFLFVSCTSIWTSDWTYGPRYLLFALPVLSLPFIETMRMVSRLKGMMKLACSAFIALLLLCSVKLQINTNTIPFLASYELAGVFAPIHLQYIDDYFLNNNVGIVAGDFVAFKYRGKPYRPMEAAKPNLPAEKLNAIPSVEAYMRTDMAFESNYFFFRDPPQQESGPN